MSGKDKGQRPSKPQKENLPSDGQRQPTDRMPVKEEYIELSWQGPIPPPGVLRELNDIVPNGAARVFEEAESETKHRQMMERREQLFPLIEGIAARLFALIFALGCLAASAYAASIGAYWPATLLGGAMIIGGMNALVRRPQSIAKPRNPTSQERRRR